MTSVFPSKRGSGRAQRRPILGAGVWPGRCFTAIAFGWVLLLSAAQMGRAEGTQIPSGAYRVAGTVVQAKGGTPLARCRVTITDLKNRQSNKFAITGDDGRFDFHVPAGRYSLEGAKRGFISAAYNQHDQFSTAIVSGADLDTESLVLRLAPNAVLTGRVLDEFSEPVRNAQVTVYREDHSTGVSRTSTYRTAATDDQGRYEVAPIDEGTYFVSAKASPWYAVRPMSSGGAVNTPPFDTSLDVVYSVTYYGDSTEADDATPIPVRGGDRLEADIHMDPVPALHLLVHVPEGGDLPTLYKPGFDGAEEPEAESVQSIAPDVYELSGIAAGRYTVRMPGGNVAEPREVNLSSSGELDVSSAKSTSQIKATVRIAGASSLPSDLQIVLRSSKGKMSYGPVDADGEADFSDVISGKYDILAESPTQHFTVIRIASEEETTSGHTLNVAPGTSLSIELSLVGGAVTVEGVAKRKGKWVAGAMVVLVPKNADDYDRIRRDESELDGSFTLRDVIPGSYTVIAIEDGWDLEWAEPGALTPYLKHGQPLEVGSRSPATIHLADAVEVLAK